MSAALTVYNAAIDAATDARCDLHRLRLAGDLEVKEYLAALAACRAVEDHLEPLRRAEGAVGSRALELARQLGEAA